MIQITEAGRKQLEKSFRDSPALRIYMAIG